MEISGGLASLFGWWIQEEPDNLIFEGFKIVGFYVPRWVMLRIEKRTRR